MDHKEKIHEGLTLIREMHNALVDLEVQLQMELAGSPADSGFTEAMEDIREKWTVFDELFGPDSDI